MKNNVHRVVFLFICPVGANLTMANIEDSDEEESVVVPVQPPKRKNISTLTVRAQLTSCFDVGRSG